MQSIHSAIFDVNKAFRTRLTYAWGYTRVDKLRERFYTFQWVENHPGVTWNHDEKRLRADDAVWQAICREKRLARCYENAYEPKWEELCKLFDKDDNLGSPVADKEEKEDDDDLFLDIPDDADLNVTKAPKDDGASSSNAAPPEEPPPNGK
ncbi:UNVERIFIED_CONTAM: hypothetical protein Sindi_1034600 [Sesamum indicum]